MPTEIPWAAEIKVKAVRPELHGMAKRRLLTYGKRRMTMEVVITYEHETKALKIH